MKSIVILNNDNYIDANIGVHCWEDECEHSMWMWSCVDTDSGAPSTI